MQPLTFLHLSDSHLMSDPDRKGMERGPTLPGAEALLSEIERLPAPVEFVLHTGDVVHDPDCEEEYQRALALFRRLSAPVYFLPGNHDRSQWFQRVLRNCESPGLHADQEIEVGGVQFLLLDSSIPQEEGGYGRLEPEQLAWLEGRCAAPDGRPLVVALHHHPLALAVPWRDKYSLRNGEALHEILLLARVRLRCVPPRAYPREPADPARRHPLPERAEQLVPDADLAGSGDGISGADPVAGLQPRHADRTRHLRTVLPGAPVRRDRCGHRGPPAWRVIACSP